MQKYSPILGVLWAAGVATHLSAQTPLGTEFVYQGRLQASGQAAITNADFQFLLFDAVTCGAQIGSTLAKNNVALVSGLFTVSLDFGPGAFLGDVRWIEVAVRSPAGTGAFTTLSPRQIVTATPQAQFAIQTRGIRIDAPNGATPNTAMGLESNGGFSEIMRISPDGNVGVGSLNPSAKLHVRAFDPVLAIQGTGAGATQTARLAFWEGNLNETAWLGFGTGGSPDLSLANKRAGGELKFFTQNTERLSIKANGAIHVNGTLTHIPETRSYTLPGVAFHPVPDDDDDFEIDVSGIEDQSGPSDNVSKFNASAHLPDGATVLAVELIGYDGTPIPDHDIRCIFGRTSFTGGFEIMAEFFSDSSGSPWRFEDITSPVINNNTHAYWVHVEMSGGFPPGEHRLIAVRLIYSVTQPLP